MNRIWWAVAGCALAALVSSCGGGADGPADSPSQPPLATPGPLRLAGPQALVSAPPLTAPALLFDWAQQHFPQFFAGAGSDGVLGSFTFRFYPQTGNYIALSDDGGVYVKGPQISGDQIAFIAPLALLNCVAAPDACPALATGSSATGTVTAAGDRDWHTVSLSAGQAYAFSLEGAATGQGTLTLPDPLLRLFNSAGQELTSDDDSGVSFNASMVCAPSASGTYYLDAEGAPADTGIYRLSATAVPGPAIACESRPADPGIDWDAPVSAPPLLQGTVTVGPQQQVGVNFDVSGAPLALESVFVSQAGADLYLLRSTDLPACLAGSAFNFIAQASFDGQTGFRSFELAPGSYAVCARNQTAQPNTMRLEMQQPTSAAGFHFSRMQFAPLVQTVAPGARLVQPVDVSDVLRIFLEGANTGGVFYIIPAEETQNFLGGQPFQHFPALTLACGGTGAGDEVDPAPELQLCELPDAGQYGLAYVNNTGSPQSIAVIGREYVPD